MQKFMIKFFRGDFVKIYLDNCCYNRPFDDQKQIKIQLETIAKIKIILTTIKNFKFLTGDLLRLKIFLKKMKKLF